MLAHGYVMLVTSAGTFARMLSQQAHAQLRVTLMLAELNASDIQRLAPAFSIYAEYVILAVMEGNCRARAWADNPQDPDIAVLWDERHCSMWTSVN